MKNSNLERRLARYAGVVGAAFLLGGLTTGCKDDLLTGQPSWLGQSIYEELQERGNYTQTLKLIDSQSEDYATVLKKTGSKTLFVANDEAWDKFFASNSWGVKSIDEMTDAQRALLFKGNMINSAYLVELLGNLPAANSDADPEEGACMRRTTSVGLLDSIPVVTKDKYPLINPARVTSDGKQIDYWARVRNNDKTILVQDNTTPTMIHFLPKFMQVNGIKDSDIKFMTNGEISSNSGAFVNGKVVTEKDITCQNGYIQVLEGVSEPLDNMANVIAKHDQFSIFNRMLDRFSYPQYSSTLTEQINGASGTPVYVRRYFNSHSKNTFSAVDSNDSLCTVTGDDIKQLTYDPGWNQYTLDTQSGTTYQEDAAVMFVPTNTALMEFLQKDGSDLNSRYQEGPGETAFDNAPDGVVIYLLNNCMQTSLKSCIPSMFSNINNSAAEKMGVNEADINHTWWASNGVVYETNTVYSVPSYSSVFSPCVFRGDEDLKIVHAGIDFDNSLGDGTAEGIESYLNNMGSKNSFIIPTDNAMKKYYDPVSRFRKDNSGSSTAVAYQFSVGKDGYLEATAPLVDWETLDGKQRGTIGTEYYSPAPKSSKTEGSTNDVFNHFKDIIYSSLYTGLFVPGQQYYTAKNGSPIIVQWNGSTVTGVAGSFQKERGYFIPVTETFDKSTKGNGFSYLVDEEPLMSTTTSPYTAINDPSRTDDFGLFATLLDGMSTISKDDGSSHATQDMAITGLNNYNYTIYVPQSGGIQDLMDAHKLPTWDIIDDIETCIDGADLDEETEAYLTTQDSVMRKVIENFVNYHIQDNAVYIDGANLSGKVYETGCLNDSTGRFVKLTVNYTQGGDMTIKDNCGNIRTVDPSENNHNILTRQYYFNGSSLTGTSCTNIYSSSFAVIHMIDLPLYSGTKCFYNPAEYEKVEEILAAHPVSARHKTIKRHRR